MQLNVNEIYLIEEAVRLHLEDISNFPEENGEDIINDYEILLNKLQKRTV